MSNQTSKNKMIISNKNYAAPEYGKTAFHCPHCEVFANQKKCFVCKYDYYNYEGDLDKKLKTIFASFRRNENVNLLHEGMLTFNISSYEANLIQNCMFSFCDHCNKYSIWIGQKMVYPHLSTASLPVAEMPEPVKKLYNEARGISNQSPRGACALLRLAIQLLVKELGEDEKKLNIAIGNLVKRGLPEKIQKALDAVRLIGNNAVHPGEIDINKDNPEIAGSLFMLVNFICEKMITENREVDAIYNSLPSKKIKTINERDKQSK